MSRSFGCSVLVTAIVGLTPLVGSAQRPSDSIPLIRLKPAEATFSERFSGLTSVRELRDGRVLLTDWREQRVVVADLRSGTSAEVGRRGRGPGEYETVQRLHALGGDTSLMALKQQRRWLLFDGAEIVATIPPDYPALIVSQGEVRGGDAAGHLLRFIYPVPPPGTTTFTARDSFYVALVDFRTARVDTVARLRRMPERVQRVVDAAGTLVAESEEILGDMPTEEIAILFHDGWLAIARLEPFAVDWRAPDGRLTRGAPLPIRPIPIDRRQRRWWLDHFEGEDLPATFPPFNSRSSPLLAASDGRLLIRPPPDADHEYARYYIIDRGGVLDGEIRLRPGERILGFGRASVYVVVTDDDGFELLRRHPWP